MLTFTPPDKTVVLGNGDDWIVFADLPAPTRFQTQQVGGATDDFLVWDGFFRANFNPAGTYVWLLTAPGYHDALVNITALEDTNV